MLYVIVSVLTVLLVVASGVALVVGLLGELGVMTLARCPACSHFVLRAWDTEQPACPYCRHEHLTHPLRTMRHPFRELVHH